MKKIVTTVSFAAVLALTTNSCGDANLRSSENGQKNGTAPAETTAKDAPSETQRTGRTTTDTAEGSPITISPKADDPKAPDAPLPKGKCAPVGTLLTGWTVQYDVNNGGDLVLRGDAGDNSLIIGGNSVPQEIVFRNSAGGSTFAVPCVKNLIVYGGDGADQMTLQGTMAGIGSISLFGEAGNDVFTVNANIGQVGNVSVNGGN